MFLELGDIIIMFAGREKQGSKSVKMTRSSEGDVNKVMSSGCSEAVVHRLIWD